VLVTKVLPNLRQFHRQLIGVRLALGLLTIIARLWALQLPVRTRASADFDKSD